MNEYIIELIISILLCLILPIFLFTQLRKRWKISWIFFAIGAGGFIFSQIVHIPLNYLLTNIHWIADLESATGIPLWRTAILMGLTAGLCEELTRWLVLVLVTKFQRKSPDGVTALGLGIGHGGIEAIILGTVLSASNIIAAVVIKLNAPSIMQIEADKWTLIKDYYLPIFNLPGSGLLLIVERLIAIVLHVSLSYWVWRAFSRNKKGLLLAAILYHTFVDMLVVLLSINGTNYWIMELVFFVIIIPAPLLTLHWAKQESFWQKPAPRKSKSTFWPVLQHEFLYLKKSHKIWLIPLVFVLITLMSVVLAYIMPEIFKSIEEMQQYVDLIPTPTVSDALVQYVKNFSQFGFIIIILIGMSSVSNEKEKGTAALFLTKPITRSSFILAKSVSLMILLFVSLSLSCVVAYIYIAILFDLIPFAHLALITLNLFLWFLPLLGLTILGSSIGKSTTTSAGIALGLCVLIMILGSIPTVQGLFPGALLAGISDYNTFLDLHPIQRWAPSAMMSAISLFILSNIISIGLLENEDFE
jgi:ABC-2 type transport system permease protein